MNELCIDVCVSEALADFRIAEHLQLGHHNPQKQHIATATTVTRVSGTPIAPESIKTKVVLTEEGPNLWLVTAEI